MLSLPVIPFPNLRTPRLLLREPMRSDDTALYAIRSNASVNQYLIRPESVTAEETRQFIEKIRSGIRRNQWLYWAITFRGEDTLLGTICLWNISVAEESAEVGYELHPDYQGQGIMQEALGQVLRFGFENLRLKTIRALTRVDNLKSVHLLEKYGFIKNEEFEENGRKIQTYVAVYSLQTTV